MNYIQTLRADLAGQTAAVETFKTEIAHFRMFLHSPKFLGDEQGQRKDWISTSDVLFWLSDVESHAFHASENARLDSLPCPKEIAKGVVEVTPEQFRCNI